MREIWIIRHGQTDMNIKGAYFGTLDVPLNETGRLQAQALRARIEWPSFDLLLESPLRRATETAAIIQPDAAFTDEPALAERAFGLWEGMTADEIRRSDPSGWAEWTTDWENARPEGGESLLEMWARSSAFLKGLLARTDWTRALLVSHAGPIRCLIAAALEQPPDGLWRFAPENAALTILSVNEENYAWLSALNR